MADNQTLFGDRDNGSLGRIYDFQEYRKRKPFFPKPMKITLGDPLNETYRMVKNILYKEKQIFALMSEQDAQTVVLVEATIKNGSIHSVSKLSQENIEEIKCLLENSI